MHKITLLFLLVGSFLLGGCQSPEPYDYTNFLESKPRSILVLMPSSTSTEIKAGPAVLANAVKPLAEAGYYVFPVTLVNETFKQNGLNVAEEVQQVPLSKLQQIFGADAVLYLEVPTYGSRYLVFNSITEVRVNARLVDIKNGNTLWTGSAVASNKEDNQQSGGGILGQVILAAIEQVVNQVSDASFDVSGITTQRLFSTNAGDAILTGPYSPNYQKDTQLQQK